MGKKELGHKIKEVYADSIAEDMGIEVGDYLVSINQQVLEDVFDYRYYIKDDYVEVLVRKANGEEWILEIDKEYEEELGVEFDNDLMSDYRSCSNKCIFCFIDQMPKGMRETLYFKDDDSRLSFLQGNYITLTNMQQTDIDRIIKMNLAPINISVQTTNKELRCKMLNNRFAGEKLKFLDDLYEGHIEMNGQIVLCKGVNDGEELEKSIDDLAKYLPFMKSVSVVPAGITKYRDNLFPLDLFTKEEAAKVIDLIESKQKQYFEEYGLHFIHASDEWYITAERSYPPEEQYDGYLQLENGVGMMRLLLDEFNESFEQFKQTKECQDLKKEYARTLTLATGKLAYEMFQGFAHSLEELLPQLKINVLCIRNDFFGETITVSGLITAKDLMEQVQSKREEGMELGRELLIPSNMLRTGEKVFLDDFSVQEVEETLGMKLVIVEPSGQDVLNAFLDKQITEKIDNDNFVYKKSYD